ncbi:hypothetical protein COLO4_36589 [Corchorus olitorius]|uniref:Uncharacterized protein n=1 Tax=Corchorus olitorius TaxID=93759 RepID=A0A1R3G7N1_9ROSI|nr:hypothetical protein COLO4_36589 [Corchorus olitorius]
MAMTETTFACTNPIPNLKTRRSCKKDKRLTRVEGMVNLTSLSNVILITFFFWSHRIVVIVNEHQGMSMAKMLKSFHLSVFKG